jgi:hypothetical protein
MESLTKKLARCCEIAQRFQAEFVNEMETYRRRPIRMAFSKEAATLTHNRFGFSHPREKAKKSSKHIELLYVD